MCMDRCVWIFQKKTPDPMACIRKINEAVAELIQMNLQAAKNLMQKNKKDYVGWKRPRFGWVKVNCDGAFSALESDGLGGVAGIGVVRNEEGEVNAGIAKKVNVSSSMELKQLL